MQPGVARPNAHGPAVRLACAASVGVPGRNPIPGPSGLAGCSLATTRRRIGSPGAPFVLAAMPALAALLTGRAEPGLTHGTLQCFNIDFAPATADCRREMAVFA